MYFNITCTVFIDMLALGHLLKYHVTVKYLTTVRVLKEGCLLVRCMYLCVLIPSRFHTNLRGILCGCFQIEYTVERNDFILQKLIKNILKNILELLYLPSPCRKITNINKVASLRNTSK